jgi:hypothetical protein
MKNADEMMLKFTFEWAVFFASWKRSVPSVRTETEPMEPKPKFAGSWRTDKEPNGP